jgi:NAD(P)-dependent dehydrogenase (short-subunit alcohol dehydrogenase family)
MNNMSNPFDFSNKTILITGAAIGIGKQTVIQLHQAGANLVLLDKDEKALKALADDLSVNARHYPIDLADIGSLQALLKNVLLDTGPLDGFVNCVGVRSRRPLNLIKPDEAQHIMNINFGAFVELVRIITKKGHFNSGLSIVSVSSIASIRGGAGVTLYAASKAAVDAAVRCLAKELAPKGIRLNTVMPAQIDTPAFRQLIEMNNNTDDPTLARQYLGLGEPADVANIIMFLLSPASKFISGSSLPVDGGFLTT